jgi:ribA/ribD-fused uncharacterized protein
MATTCQTSYVKIMQFTPDIGFSGKMRFLSNFYIVDVKYEGIVYPTSENAYQAAKFKNKELRLKFVSVTPGDAKRFSRILPIREDWDDVKLEVMQSIIDIKFNNPSMAKLLSSTGNDMLIEWNHWHDNFWGVCKCEKCSEIVGKNMLGRVLMNKRSTLTF